MAVVNVTKDRYTVDSVRQWDVDQVLEIRGLSLSSTPEIHFTNSSMDRAIVKYATMDSAGVVTVDIPNSILQKPCNIVAYVCIAQGTTFKTLYEIVIPLNARKQPADYTLTSDDGEVYSFVTLEREIDEVRTASNNAYNLTVAKLAEATTAFSNAQTTYEKAYEEVQTYNDAIANCNTAAEEATKTANGAINTARVINYFDNSNFRKPINQRQRTTLTGNGYIIDRWMITGASLGACVATVSDAGIGMAANGDSGMHLEQRFVEGALDSTKTYTAALYLSNGTVKVTTPNFELGDYDYVSFELNDGETAVYAVLYEGEYTADNLPVRVDKAYTEELAECRRYLYRIGENDDFFTGMATDDDELSFIVPLHQTLVKQPTIDLYTYIKALYESGSSSQPVNTDTVSFIVGDNSIMFTHVESGEDISYTRGSPVLVHIDSAKGYYIEISAEL